MSWRALLLLLAAAVPALPQQYRAFWADAFHAGYKTPAEVDRMVDDVAAARGNAIFVQVRRRADSYYLQTREVPAQDAAYAPGFDALAYLIDRAHARGMEVHGWFVVYPLWPNTIAPPANPQHVWHQHGPRAAGADMWMQVNAQGQTMSSFDPAHPGVQRYLAEVITDPLRHYDLDGIHLDYIRYDETGNYGGNPVSLERFGRQELRATRPAANDAAWADFRRRNVTQLVRQIYLRSIEARPRVKVSAALISWGNGPLTDAGFRSTDAYATVFQDWRAWMEEGILDLAMPMHYFRDAANAAFLDRWTAFARDRVFRRGYLPGLAPYLNPIADSLNQVRRTLAAPGPLGVCFYSYASTNTLNAAGLPLVANEEFYRQAGELFGSDARVPELPWKARPEFGHIAGALDIAGPAPEWLADGATVTITSDTGRDFARTATTDGTGFFGFVDVPPDRYRLKLERGGRLIGEWTPQDVRAGQVARFDLRLTAANFAAVLPRLTRVPERAAPGEIITVEGVNLGPAGRDEAAAPGVPLPAALNGTQVMINGTLAAPLFAAGPGRAVLQLPYIDPPAEGWSIVVRQGGMESAAMTARAVAAVPVVLGVRRRAEDGILEIYATGLGLLTAPVEAGRGADPTTGALPQVANPVEVTVNGARVEGVLFAGLTAYQPGIYQINVTGAPASGTLRLSVAGEESNAITY